MNLAQGPGQPGPFLFFAGEAPEIPTDYFHGAPGFGPRFPPGGQGNREDVNRG
jgi:hypothetical protein